MILKLFTTFFKIGLFTFGGGYGMISLVKDECIDKKSWITDEEFVDMIAIAESTPGPIAINMATYVGHKQKGIIGAVVATFGVVLPSMIIIYLISLFLKDFLSIKIISHAFFGIRIAVSIIIIKTAYNLIRNEYKSNKNKFLTIVLFFIYTIILLTFDILNIKISSVLLIMSALVLGVIINLVNIKVDR